jgi:formate dehydrogenase subunit gamma
MGTPLQICDIAVLDAIAAHKDRPGALLPILHAVQDKLGYVPSESIPFISDALNLSRAEVHGVITFYHHFRTEKPAKHVVQICRAEACQSRGSEHLEHHAKSTLGVDYHHATKDGNVQIEAAYCLGNCACGPNITIDGELHGRVNAKRFNELLDELK